MRSPYSKITDKEKLQIIKLYNEGKTTEEISKITYISYAGVQKTLDKYKVPKRKPNWPNLILTDDLLRKIRYRLDHGETQRKIANELGVHESAISLALKRKGI